MVSASFVYLSIFTLSNVMIASFLQAAVNVYKADGKLPNWVIYSRMILDRLDEPCDGNEFKNDKKQKMSDEEPTSVFDIFNDKELGEDQKPASMSFLQIKSFQENGQMYDFRDEHEYKMSKNPETDLNQKYQDDVDIDFINTMNFSRETDNNQLSDLSRVEQDLYENNNDKDGFKNDYESFNKESGESGVKDEVKRFEDKITTSKGL